MDFHHSVSPKPVTAINLAILYKKNLDAGDENAKAEYEQKFAKKDDDSQFYEVK